MPFRRRRPIARMATTAVVAGTAAHMGAKSAQRSAAADQDQYQDQAQDQAPPAPAPAADPAAPEAAAPEAAESPQVEHSKAATDRSCRGHWTVVSVEHLPSAPKTRQTRTSRRRRAAS